MKAQGFTAIKISPFDGVMPDELDTPEVKKAIANGIECTFAAREAVGPAVDVLLDCHWRFDEAAAKEVILALAPMRPFWLECMVSERPKAQPALARVCAFGGRARHTARRRRAPGRDQRLQALRRQQAAQGGHAGHQVRGRLQRDREDLPPDCAGRYRVSPRTIRLRRCARSRAFMSPPWPKTF